MGMKPFDMGVLFDECAERGHHTRVHLDRPFDIAPEGGLDYDIAALAELVDHASGWLAGAGARRGDRVAIVKNNHWDYDLLACAAVRLGSIPAQISAELPPVEVGKLLDRLRPAVLVTTAGLVRRWYDSGVDVTAMASRVLTLDEPVPSGIPLDSVRGVTPPAPRRPAQDEPLVINHTSGTTGVPKLVTHTTGTIIVKLAGLESIRLPVVGVRRDDVLANANSYAHGRTFCWTASVFCLAPRAISILTTSDPNAADPTLRANPPTIVEALPASFVRFRPLLDRLYNPFRNVRLFVSTYDAVHPPTVRAYLAAIRRRSPLWMQGWGQSETGPLTFRFLTRRSLARCEQRYPTTRNLGRPIPMRTRLRLVDPVNFRPVPRGKPGVVLVSTAATCRGYLGEERRWAAKWLGGWFNIGDMAIRRWDGSVLLLDREVDHTGDLSCLEVEDVLEDRLPQAVECVALDVQGSSPLPVVVTADGQLDLHAWERAVDDLPPMAEPVALTWDELPRTGTGKVRRRELMQSLLGAVETAGSGRWT